MFGFKLVKLNKLIEDKEKIVDYTTHLEKLIKDNTRLLHTVEDTTNQLTKSVENYHKLELKINELQNKYVNDLENAYVELFAMDEKNDVLTKRISELNKLVSKLCRGE